MIDYVLTFTVRLMDVWRHIIDQNLPTKIIDGYTKQDLIEIVRIRAQVKKFKLSLLH